MIENSTAMRDELRRIYDAAVVLDGHVELLAEQMKEVWAALSVMAVLISDEGH